VAQTPVGFNQLEIRHGADQLCTAEKAQEQRQAGRPESAIAAEGDLAIRIRLQFARNTRELA
jgi:hypothetical protein